MLLSKILLATDGSKDSRLALKAAAVLSARSGAELHLVHAYSYPHDFGYPGVLTEDYLSAREEEAREVIQEERIEIEELGSKVTQTHIDEGPPVEVILDLADDLEADLIVLGSRGRGAIQRLVLGSVSEGVVHHANQPVLVMRGTQEAWPPGWIVIGDDDSEAARHAGELAATIGGLFGAWAEIVRAFPQLPEQDAEGRALDPRVVDDALSRAEKALRERADKLEKMLGRRPRAVIASGDPTMKILAACEDKDSPLVAVGSRGLGTMERMRLGSTSTKILRTAPGPVLICPSR